MARPSAGKLSALPALPAARSAGAGTFGPSLRAPTYTSVPPLGAERGPDTGPIGTSKLHTQVLGSIVGRRGAGITTLASGDPTHHAMGHYGKKGLPGLDGGDFGGDGNF